MQVDIKRYAKIWGIVIAVFAVFLYLIGQRGEGKFFFSPVKPGVVVAFGDSLTEGIGASSPEKAYPARLEALLGRKVVNAGHAGDTSYEALARVGRDVLPLSPALVVITIGGNDEIRQIPNETTAGNLANTVLALHKAGIAVAFIDIDPPAGGWRFKMLAKQNRDMGVLHIEGAMEGLWGNRELMSDAIHPNDAGYRLMAERIAAALKPHLK